MENLVRMAAEIDELERSAVDVGVGAGSRRLAPVARAVNGGGRSEAARRRRMTIRIAALASAAACAGVVVKLSLPVPAPVVRPVEVVVVPSPVVPVVVAPELVPERPVVMAAEPRVETRPEEASVILAITADASGGVQCVRWRPHDFGGRKVEEVRPGELAAATYGQECATGPHRFIAVGLTGPRDSLPENDHEAEMVAQCIIGGGSVPGCAVEPASYTSSSMACLPRGMKAVVETMAMRGR
jgi:hypothetical protein